MSSKSKINIVSEHPHEFSSNITIDNIAYYVQTDDMGLKSCRVISNVYLKGEIVFTRKSDYSHLIKLINFKDRLHTLMKRQHKSTLDAFKSERTKKQKLKSEYFDEIQQLLRRGNSKTALNTLKHALEKFPADPFLLSYYGCLVAIIENNPNEGIKICKDAIKKLDNFVPFGSEFYYPVFYLNLGRAYLKDNKKTEAINSFLEGLRNDSENHDLLWELKKLGTRKKTMIPFLRRTNPINKYIGKILYKRAK